MKENEGKSYRKKVGKKRRKIIENRGKMQECQEKGKKKNERKGRKIVENGGKTEEHGGMTGKKKMEECQEKVGKKHQKMKENR